MLHTVCYFSAEVARILSFALVHDATVSTGYPAVCRIRMTNPGLYGYDNVFVEARSDVPEPFFLLPLHSKVSSRSPEYTDSLYVASNAEVRTWNASENQAKNMRIFPATVRCGTKLPRCAKSGESTDLYPTDATIYGQSSKNPSENTISASCDESVYVPGTAASLLEVSSASSRISASWLTQCKDADTLLSLYNLRTPRHGLNVPEKVLECTLTLVVV